MERFILYILKTNLLASVCILMVLFISYFVKSRYSSHWRYMMWLLITVFLLFPIKVFSESFTIEIPQQADTFMVDSQENGAITNLKTDTLSDSTTNSINEITMDKELTPVKNYKSSFVTLTGFLQGFFYLWLVGVAGLSVYKIIAYIVSMASLLRWSVPQKSENILDLYCSVCEERGIKKQPRLMLNIKLTSPILAGLKDTYLCLPDVLYTEEELKLILIHELAHYRHKDLWYKLLLVIVNTLYWFNPLLYLMAKEADKDLEYICDSNVLVNCTQPNHIIYSKLLLKTASTQNSTHYLSASLNDSATSLKERIIYMMKAKSLKRGIIPVIILTSILVFSNTLIGCSIQKKPSDSDSKVTSSSSVDKEDEPKVTPEVIKPTEKPTSTTSSSTESTPSQPIKPTEDAGQEGEDNKNQTGDTETSDNNQSDTNKVKAKVKVYEANYKDAEIFGDNPKAPVISCLITISNVTETSFDFTIYEVDSMKNTQDLIFRTHTAVFTGDGTEAFYDGKEYDLSFTFPDYYGAYPDVIHMEITGFAPVEGRTYDFGGVPGHEFG